MCKELGEVGKHPYGAYVGPGVDEAVSNCGDYPCEGHGFISNEHFDNSVKVEYPNPATDGLGVMTDYTHGPTE